MTDIILCEFPKMLWRKLKQEKWLSRARGGEVATSSRLVKEGLTDKATLAPRPESVRDGATGEKNLLAQDVAKEMAGMTSSSVSRHPHNQAAGAERCLLPPPAGPLMEPGPENRHKEKSRDSLRGAQAFRSLWQPVNNFSKFFFKI